MTINKRVKEIRKSNDLTMEKFGERIGVTKSTISNIENGNRGVTDQMFKSICREFNVREEWLRDGIEPVYDLSEESGIEYIELLMNGVDSSFRDIILDIIKSYSELNDDNKKTVVQFIKSVLKKQQDRN
ncbi:MAG: helix-turn-helix transcriptional regulator [Lachnospiraceae bacterium]|nr:helix-turn-helix transcriptional regulator [Lachnospiraceae bacterium]